MATFEDLYTERLNVTLNTSDSNALYTSTRRQQAINDAVQEFAALTECYVRRSTIAVTHDVTEYGLSTISDFSRISEKGLIEYHRTDSNGQLTQLAGEDFPRRDELWRNRHTAGWRSSTTPVIAPQGHYVRSDGGAQRVGLSEPPSVSSNVTAKLIVPYVARPPVMTASTEIPFTDSNGATRHDLTEYHLAFPHYAAYKLLPLIGDLQGAQQQLQTFLGYVARYAQNQRPKGGSHVTLARNYFGRRAGSGDPSLDRDSRWGWR
jgi:hypothetical protein